MKILYPNGDEYEGNINSEGLKDDAKGTYKFQSMVKEDSEEVIVPTYAGAYVNGNRTGLGSMKYSNGSVYIGMWANGRRQGKGHVTYANGDIYSGKSSKWCVFVSNTPTGNWAKVSRQRCGLKK